jgi:hypothetical protein
MSKKKPNNKGRQAQPPPNSPRDTPVVQAQPERQEKAQQPEHEPKPSRWYTKLTKIKSELVMTVFTGVAAFSTAVYAIVSYGQWEAMRDATKVSNRPYIGVKEVSIGEADASALANHGGPIVVLKIKPPDPQNLVLSKAMAVEITLLNSGNTPAIATEGWIEFVVLPKGITEDNTTFQNVDPRSHHPRQTLPKDGMRKFSIASTFTDGELADVKLRKQWLTALGVVTYTDLFHGKRTTKFCYVYQVSTDRMVTCQAHNTMD